MFLKISNFYTNQFVERFAEAVREKIILLTGADSNGLFEITLEILIWGFLFLLLDLVLQNLFTGLFRKYSQKTGFKWVPFFYRNKVFRTLVHFIVISVLITVNPFVFQQYPGVDRITDKLIGLLIIVVFILFIHRMVNGYLELYESNNEARQRVGVRAFGQMVKVVVLFLGIIVFIATLFDVSLTQIFTILGALMAVILLIFRDALLGFISGVQIASSKSINIGDWISVPKYKVEGTVLEINLTLTKVRNFDKSMATIPTYDLISSEVINYSRMSDTNTRRIRRSIVFNVNSFQFCNTEMLKKYEKIDLIHDYIHQIRTEIAVSNKTVKYPEHIINGRQLTNIGTFRVYATEYLKNHSEVSQTDTLVVRQLQPTSLGMPLEIYCFANNSQFAVYEKTQADIFDHLITASKEFGLEVSQPFIIKKTDDET